MMNFFLGYLGCPVHSAHDRRRSSGPRQSNRLLTAAAADSMQWSECIVRLDGYKSPAVAWIAAIPPEMCAPAQTATQATIRLIRQLGTATVNETRRRLEFRHRKLSSPSSAVFDVR